MKAYRLVQAQQEPELREVEVPEPGPGQVLIRVAGAGACHSDLHVMEWPPDAVPGTLPFTLGHENAGEVEALGAGVDGFEIGEPVAVYGAWGCGRCRACRESKENYCERQAELGAFGGGLGLDGGMAELMLVPAARLLVPLEGLDPVEAAPLTDAGLTPYHAIKRSLHRLVPGSSVVVIGVGGLGHMGVQILEALSPARVIAVDVDEAKLRLAREVGADETFLSGPEAGREIRALTRGLGAQLVLDFVGADATMRLAAEVARADGEISIVGLAGGALPVAFGQVPFECPVSIPYWGSAVELMEVLALARAGAVKAHVERFPLEPSARGVRADAGRHPRRPCGDRPVSHRVVIVGGGFGGLEAAKALRRAPVEVTVVDRQTHHLFQPLLYHVATGILSEGNVAPPIRDVLRHQRNAHVVLAEMRGVDLERKTITCSLLDRTWELDYDSLIVAAGSAQSYFGRDEFGAHAPGMKTIDDALEVRGRIFGAFELAELEQDPVRRSAWLTFVVVGAGPTGVEMAGQIAELSRYSLPSNFRRIDTADARIVLLDGAPRILPSFDERLARRAAGKLERMGVEIRTGALVTGMDAAGVELQAGDAVERLAARTKIWSAGVQASPLGSLLAAQAAVEPTRSGQVPVLPDCTLPGHPEVFVVGDLMALDGLPGLAEVAIQSGRHAAAEIRRRLDGKAEPRPFRYRDLGNLASVSRYYAIGERRRVRVWGFAGWLVWLVVHLTFLTGFKNRVSALFHWTIGFFGRSRAERTITAQQVFARQALTAPADPDAFDPFPPERLPGSRPVRTMEARK